ncbi:MAG: hypothetical protein JWQ09_3326 [Segetibacter sp.]|nr:hypothetical protein [Segetibacter sp.]
MQHRCVTHLYGIAFGDFYSCYAGYIIKGDLPHLKGVAGLAAYHMSALIIAKGKEYHINHHKQPGVLPFRH